MFSKQCIPPSKNTIPSKHGPLVDLSSRPQPGVEEVEIYPVNPPNAYIRITYDHSTHEYTYVLEPVLTAPEADLLKELKERLFETLDINTKDISKEEAAIKLRAAATDVIQDFGIKNSIRCSARPFFIICTRNSSAMV